MQVILYLFHYISLYSLFVRYISVNMPESAKSVVSICWVGSLKSRNQFKTLLVKRVTFNKLLQSWMHILELSGRNRHWPDVRKNKSEQKTDVSISDMSKNQYKQRYGQMSHPLPYSGWVDECMCGVHHINTARVIVNRVPLFISANLLNSFNYSWSMFYHVILAEFPFNFLKNCTVHTS